MFRISGCFVCPTDADMKRDKRIVIDKGGKTKTFRDTFGTIKLRFIGFIDILSITNGKRDETEGILHERFCSAAHTKP